MTALETPQPDFPVPDGGPVAETPVPRGWRRAIERLSVQHLLALVLPTMLVAVYLAHLSRTGLAGRVLYEAADSAGDMLQVRRGIERGWFVTGHHSDVGVHHPGPVALWVKALVELLHRAGLGGSVYGLAMTVFLGVRLALLAVAAEVTARATRSRVVGWGAALGVLLVVGRQDESIGFDLHGSTIPHLASWGVLVMLTGAAALGTTRNVGMTALVLGAGITAHTHTPSFPLGVLGLLAAGTLLFRRDPTTSAAQQWVLRGLWSLFVVPLAVRVVLEPGFPFNYGAAVRQRQTVATTNAGRSSLEALGRIIDLPQPMLVLGVLLPLLVGVGLWRASRTGALLLAAASIYGGVVLRVSPPQERVATEVFWVAGLLLFSGAVVVGGGLLVLSGVARRVTARVVPAAVRRNGAVLGATLTAVVVLTVGASTLAAALPERLSTSGGADGRHVPVLADAIEDWTAGEPFALVLADPNWFSTSSGVLLELQRRDLDFCVTSDSSYEATLATFLDPDRVCARQRPSLPGVLIAWDAERGLANVPGAALLLQRGTGAPVPVLDDPDTLVCSQMGTAGMCTATLPDTARELARTYEDDEGSYGMVHPLRLLGLACSTHPYLACAELAAGR